MHTGTVRRFALAGAILMFASLASQSLNAEEGGDPALARTLAQVKLFAGLTDAERDSLQAVATLRRAKAGERIIEQGKPTGRMFVILAGPAEVRVNGKHIVTLSGQSLVGEIEFLDQLPASADVVLPGESDLLELDNDKLAALMEKQPRLGYVLIREIARIEARRLRDTNPK